MKQFKKYFENSNKKLQYLIIMVVIVLIASIAIPSLARYKNRTFNDSIVVWDGSIATSYRKGSGNIDDPYIISNGSELAYFKEQLKTTNYEGKYFELNNDIVLNDGVFSYNSDGIKYTKNNVDYSVPPYTNNYELGTINTFESLNNFKGNFNGNSYRIYGLYITSDTLENLGLFTNLQGNISNLYVENALIYGGNTTGGIASNASNSTLKNVLYNGYVVSGSAKEETITINIDDIIKNASNEELIDNINIDIPKFNGVLEKVTLTGNYTVSNEFGSLRINNQEIENGDFEIELNSLESLLEFKYSSTSDTTFNLSNLKYNISYKNSNTSGIIALGNNVTLENVINKANVYGNVYASGLIDSANETITINNSYNTGSITSNNMGTGLIGNITQNSNNVTITNSYNSGTLTSTNTSGIIGQALNNTGSIDITNTFNTTNDYAITKIENSTVNVNNSYITHYNQVNSGTLNTFTTTTLENLKNKTYLKTYLNFNEFISEEDLNNNPNNIWVFEDNGLPILFIDDLNNPIANINVSTYSWNNLGYNLNALKFNSNIAFNIEGVDNLRPLKETYYYVSKSKEALTKEDIEAINDWEAYTDIKEINEEGFYVIYAKVVDYNDNITYLNTDLLVLDLTGAEINITLNNNSWNSFKTNLDNVYIPQSSNLEISALDDISGVSGIYYYVSKEELEQSNLEELNDKWTLYSSNIPIEEDSIVYVKVVDNVNYVTYANTDKIIINGYKQTKLTAGRNIFSSDNISITNKSSITFNYSYNDTNAYETGYKHKLISSILLPKNTEITLIDNINNKVYKYKIETDEDIFGYNSNSKATYSLNSFNEVGKASMNNAFTDLESGEINEDFSIILDFKNTNITNDIIDAYLYMEIQDENGNMVRPTLTNTIKKYNVFVNKDASLYLNTNYNGSVDYNSDSRNDILLNAGITYKYNNSQIIYDTTYENKNIALAVKLVDSNNEIVSKEYLKNIVFKIGDTKYFVQNDNIVRINLESMESVSKTLTIETYADNIKIPSGSYKFQIGVMASYDGAYSDNINYSVSIPVDITNNLNNNYNFDVIMDDINKIIPKNETTKLSFNILQKGYFASPNIRVSLYKKDELTAYNQNYTRIDMQEYVTNTLTKYSDNVYYASINPFIYDGTSNTYNLFEVNLDTEKLENTGYMFVFELYDGNTKIGTIQKKFIIK